MDDLTLLLNRLGDDGNVPAEQLLPLVYQKLRQVAAEKMAKESAGQTLQATALVHEAWLRVGGEARGWKNRWHFFGAAAEAMRRILIERARRRQAARYGGGLERMSIDEVAIEAPAEETEMLEVHEALNRLAEIHPQKAELIKLKYFVGLSLHEAAEVLGLSPATAERRWAGARVWLFREIQRLRAGEA